MGTPQLLESCFQIFRLNPQLFSSVLVDRRRRQVRDADIPLSCGATLNQAIAFVVRGCAWRYFRRKLDPPKRRRSHGQPARCLWTRIASLWRGKERQVRPLTAADRLYRALREYLMYEWQIRLIPHYAPLPLGVVLRLGPRILDYRDPVQLAALARGELPEPPKPATNSTPPVLRGDGREPASILGRDLSTLDPEACWGLWSHMGARALFPALRAEEARARIEMLAKTNSDLLAGLFYMVRLDARQVLLLLMAAVTRLGDDRFVKLLGADADPAVLNRLGSALSLTGAASVEEPSDFIGSCQVTLAAVFGPMDP